MEPEALVERHGGSLARDRTGDELDRTWAPSDILHDEDQGGCPVSEVLVTGVDVQPPEIALVRSQIWGWREVANCPC
jgi:hypothetical protein